MDGQVIIVTGAAGFLGSAITVDLADRHCVVAIDRREPSEALSEATPNVAWHRIDIADEKAVATAFEKTKRQLGRIDFVLHFAAFYHFGSKWRPEYQRTNVDGTANVVRSATETGTKRMIFASSMVAMLPPPHGQRLSERTPTAGFIPYGRSKSLGERMIREASDYLPSIVLRIGGVFSDWCELPPLYSLIRLWTGRSALSRLMVGHGTSGIPYLHRDDLVRLVRCCIDRHRHLASHEVFLASQHGVVLHNDLFPLIRQARAKGKSASPVFISSASAELLLGLQLALGFVTRKVPYERPWMLRYVDCPWVADTTYTRTTLTWDCTDGMEIRDRLPKILERRIKDPATWERRNRVRNEGRYAYSPDEV